MFTATMFFSRPDLVYFYSVFKEDLLDVIYHLFLI